MIITKNIVWAEEATSIVFADLLKQAKNPNMYVEKPDSYIYRVANNVAIKVKFLEEFNKAELDEGISSGSSAIESVEFIMDFDRLMENFSDRQREYAIMHFVHDIKYKDIAAKFNVSENAVKQSFIYIKKRIKEFFRPL